jgi:RNA polymerase sigma-70 factor (ECF subfamily)
VDQELNQLIYKAKRGDQQAFAALVRKYQGSVFRQAYAMVGDRMEAEDIAQDAFVKAFYAIKKLDNEYAFTSWLSRIVSNACYDHLKKASRRKNVPLLDHERKASRESPIERSQTRMTIRQALQKLSPDHREIIILRDVQGYTYNEIADILNIPVGTVKSRISIARTTLKEELTRGEESD